eukprot:4803508-Ditylum_brightwellii.AAC.1
MGIIKFHPKGPKYKYNGKDVDCLAFDTESGGVTDKNWSRFWLTLIPWNCFQGILKYAQIPILIIDGH